MANVTKGKSYTVYCSPEETKIINEIKKEYEKINLDVSYSEIIKSAIRFLGEKYEK